VSSQPTGTCSSGSVLVYSLSVPGGRASPGNQIVGNRVEDDNNPKRTGAGRKKGQLKKLLGVLSAAVALTLGAAPAGTANAASPAAASVVAANAAVASAGFTMHDKWAREFTRYGDADTSVYNIEHVTELQYRLRWAGVYGGPVTGNFGPLTRDGVKRFQSREGLRQTGVAGHLTWAHLLHDTVRHRGQIPSICKTDGWHACYDRSMHQVTLWRNGVLRNTWLVRGGGYDTQTRTGNTTVYSRDKDHISGLYNTPMPYSQFFDGGEALHGSAYMMDPFVDHSHGCVNMYIEDARQLWNMTYNKRLYVSVYGAWG